MNNICAIHQSNFLPWIGYFIKIDRVDEFVFLDNVDIEIGGSKAITNRTKINTHQGHIWLSNPIIKSKTKKINEINYVESTWKQKNLKTIFLNYKKTKYFDETFPLIEKIFKNESNNLSEFNYTAILLISEYLNIKTNFSIASELNISNCERNGRIIQICEKLNCSKYFSGNGGRDYHDESLFRTNNIDIEYSKFTPEKYTNYYNVDFSLSILDSLFNICRNSLITIFNEQKY